MKASQNTHHKDIVQKHHPCFNSMTFVEKPSIVKLSTNLDLLDPKNGATCVILPDGVAILSCVEGGKKKVVPIECKSRCAPCTFDKERHVPPKMTEKQPKYFTVDMPVLNKKGGLTTEGDGTLKKVRKCGMWTCYHSAHIKGWRKFTQTNQSILVTAGTNKRPCTRHSIG